jgi:hypothetical protein
MSDALGKRIIAASPEGGETTARISADGVCSSGHAGVALLQLIRLMTEFPGRRSSLALPWAGLWLGLRPARKDVGNLKLAEILDQADLIYPLPLGRRGGPGQRWPATSQGRRRRRPGAPLRAQLADRLHGSGVG